METTDKTSALILTSLMRSYGVCKVFASPGSRNVPLLIAFNRESDFEVEMVIDERSAAFMALGYASIADKPVALLCTSGTAMLNYLPAVAEAFYRQIPLLVITADRPTEWIGQKDSQTLPQSHGLSPFVHKSVDIPDFSRDDKTKVWWCNRVLNEALTACVSENKGPVHVNMQFDMPLNGLSDGKMIEAKKIETLRPSGKLDTTVARELGRQIASPHKVMIVVGQMNPSQRLNKAMMKLSGMPNVVILAESIANIHADKVITQVDTVISKLASMRDAASYCPDTVIYLGGSLVSGKLKGYLRKNRAMQSWYVGTEDSMIDTFMSLSLRIDMEPETFMPQLASAMYPHRDTSDFAAKWDALKADAIKSSRQYIEGIGWSSLKAVAKVVDAIPDRWNVQLSNGMSVRLTQLLDTGHIHRIDCNRGVSGIDGSTSTAIGAQLAYRHGITLLITGDMSLAYDLTAIGIRQVTNRMRIIVLDNGGGNIFRCIPSTDSLLELESCLEMGIDIPSSRFASLCGWRCLDAYDDASLDQAMSTFLSTDDKPCMLIIKTDGKYDAAVWKGLFTYLTESNNR